MAYVHGVTNLGDTNPAFFSEPGSGFFFILNFFLIDLIPGLDPSLDPGFAERPGWICRSLFSGARNRIRFFLERAPDPQPRWSWWSATFAFPALFGRRKQIFGLRCPVNKVFHCWLPGKLFLIAVMWIHEI